MSSGANRVIFVSLYLVNKLFCYLCLLKLWRLELLERSQGIHFCFGQFWLIFDYLWFIGYIFMCVLNLLIYQVDFVLICPIIFALRLCCEILRGLRKICFGFVVDAVDLIFNILQVVMAFWKPKNFTCLEKRQNGGGNRQ